MNKYIGVWMKRGKKEVRKEDSRGGQMSLNMTNSRCDCPCVLSFGLRYVRANFEFDRNCLPNSHSKEQAAKFLSPRFECAQQSSGLENEKTDGIN